jgi:hypothetical protein
MSVAHVLWIINIPLTLLALFLARDTFSVRRRRARDSRRRFLEEGLIHLRQLPDAGPIREGWAAVIGQSIADEDMSKAQILAIRALEHANVRTVAALYELVKTDINLMNKFAELVDEGLVRPMDIARQYPDQHAALLDHLALVAPFIWYESIFRGRGRWGYRVLRLKTIYERLRVVSPRPSLRGPLELEVGGIHFLALESVTAAERVLGFVRLAIRSPTINVRSKLAQVRERITMMAKLREVGVDIDGGVGGPGPAVDW